MPRVLPSPTLVIGLGRFGLAVLERLGDDWMGLKTSGADASLKNLRLLWVHPGPEEGDDLWRERDAKAAAVACEIGEGDLPSLALDLAILRSLGLVRFRDGIYQVAVPRDAGPVDEPVEFDHTRRPPGRNRREEGTEEEADPSRLRVVRRRYFEWLGLSPDPIIAVERLRRLLERHHELDLFVTPILNRVRQGHSPGVLIAVIGRCRALAQSRDPAPWEWLRERLPERADGQALEIPLAASWLEQERRRSQNLEDVAPEPLPGWKPAKQGADGEADEKAAKDLALVLPAPFAPRPTDLTSPLDPIKFLEIDWETSGWASESTGRLKIWHVDLGPFRAGLFDHGTPLRGRPSVEMLGPRLQELARLVYQGLVRLWIDLQRERVEDLDPSLKRRLYQEPLDAALRQSLEILGELLVRPLVSEPEAIAGPHPKAQGESSGRAELELASAPSCFLASAVVERRDLVGRAETALTDRLADLGHVPHGGIGEQEVQLLFQEVELALADARADDDGTRAGRSAGLLALRRMLNDITRQLYSFSFLTEYRRHPTRHPPRLTVFVVGDMGEPFTRVETRDVLREVHAELLRAFSPIFEFYREGFNRCLSIVPVLWMPHPSDPFGGASPAANRTEEAAIIDRIHGIRRWVESVLPASRRRIAQIFVNGRVTDNAVLSLRDAVRQTRDFISFQARNDVGADDWLRRTATGPGTSDLFSSFSCYEIDFPAERCREYLANRLARVCLARIRSGQDVSPAEPPAESFAPIGMEELAREGNDEFERQTSEAGAQMAGEVTGRVDVRPETIARELFAAFDKSFEDSLKDKVQARWGELIRNRGRVDDQVDKLRHRIASEVLQTLSQVRQHGDHLIEEKAGKGGLPAALAGFDALRTATRDELQRQEEQRQDAADLCRKHGIPSLDPLGRRREEVIAATEKKPEHDPMRFGIVVWGLLSFVLGAPLAESLAALLMDRQGLAPLAAALGRLDGLFGGALVFLPVVWLLRRHMRRAVERVRESIAALAREVEQLFFGTGLPPEQEGRPSIRSLFMSRLALTGALATRGFARRVYEQAMVDQKLAFRLSRSAEIQALHLTRLAEDLGVRPAAGGAAALRDDLRNLFATRTGEAVERLIEPGLLEDYFRRKVGPEEEIGPLIHELITESGGLAKWRRSACLSDTARLLSLGRRRFQAVVETPIAAHETFAEEAGRRLCAFVARHYPNIGFGAKFIGYEGLDPDGIHVSADAALVLESSLRTLFEQSRREQARRQPAMRGEKAAAVPAAIDVVEAQVRPNAAWLLSLVQGIRAHSFRNLKRFESFHDRVHMPDDRTFPLSQEEQHGLPVNHLSSYGAVGARLRDEIQQIEARRKNGAGSDDE